MIIAIAGVVVAVVVPAGIAVWQNAKSRKRPQPHFVIAGDPSAAGGSLPVKLTNAGGGAQVCHALAHAGRSFYEYRGAVTEQLQESAATMHRLGEAPVESESPFVVWCLARDDRGTWWDARRGRRIREPINDWLAERSRQARMAIKVEIL